MRFCLSAPFVAFSSPPLSSPLPGAPLALSKTGPVARNGLSLPWNSSHFREPHSRIDVPGLFLRSPARLPANSFGLLLHRRSAVRPASGCFFASARCLLATALDPHLLRPPLPFGTVTSLWIEAFCQSCCRSVRLPIPPDFLSLPAPVFLSLVGGSGSMFQVRYVSGGLLFLKPLGTSFTMRLPHSGVNDFWMSNTYFQQFFFCVISMTCMGSEVDVLWIKRRSIFSFCDTETKGCGAS